MGFESGLEKQAVLRRARSLFQQGLHLDAKSICHDVLKLRKSDPQAMLLLAEITWSEGRHDDAITMMKRYVRLHPSDANGHRVLSELLIQRGRFSEAIATLERQLRRDSKNRDAIRGLAHAHEMRGDNEKATALLEPFIKAGAEDYEMARIFASLQTQAKCHQLAIAALQRHVDRPDVPVNVREQMWYLMGRAYERLNDVDRSFAAYRMANEINPVPFDPKELVDKVDRMIEVFSPARLASYPRATHGSELPVFIVSRPRAGSTLVERIIGSHPRVHAAGEISTLSDIVRDIGLAIGSTLEYPECIVDLEPEDVDQLGQRYLDEVARLEPGCLRVTDKHLGSYAHLGLVSLLLPGARIIDLRRDPLDNCVACWMSFLGRAHPYSYRLEHLGMAYRQYERLMDHWHRVLDLRMLRVNYEDLVADQEAWSRRIIEFVGLPWDDQCLRFYEAGRTVKKNMTAAPTLSYAQVTNPIYRTSVGRAEQFRDYLQPLHDALGMNMTGRQRQVDPG